VNKEVSHYVRLFGGNKIGNLIFLLPLAYYVIFRLLSVNCYFSKSDFVFTCTPLSYHILRGGAIAEFAILISRDQFLLQVLSPDCTNNIGSIVHSWDSMSSGYKLTVTFPTTEVTTEMKAVILGAAFLLVGNTKFNSIR
jgi:hypothetical protein